MVFAERQQTISVTATPESAGFSLGGLARIQTWMQEYVDRGKLPCAMIMVSRYGEIIFLESFGKSDPETDLEVAPDTIFRIYSMTKPITAVAVMMLQEEGHFSLDDPIANFLPILSDMEVYLAGEGDAIQTEQARSPITIRQLLTHTSGFCYGFFEDTSLAHLYQSRKTDFNPDDGSLEEVVARLSSVPLLFHPGSRWNYGVSIDVVGHLVEVVSGQTLDVFLAERIFDPLGMVDTSFSIAGDKIQRFSALYQVTPKNPMQLADPRVESVYSKTVTTFSGGAGLLSTVSDYFRFMEMIRCGGQGSEGRLLRPETVSSMTCNQLPGDLASMGQATFNEMSYEGIGMGLGFSVVLDPGRIDYLCTIGEIAWGGVASTAFWIDTANELTVSFFTQLAPSDTYPIRWELRNLLYQALTDTNVHRLS